MVQVSRRLQAGNHRWSGSSTGARQGVTDPRARLRSSRSDRGRQSPGRSQFSGCRAAGKLGGRRRRTKRADSVSRPTAERSRSAGFLGNWPRFFRSSASPWASALHADEATAIEQPLARPVGSAYATHRDPVGDHHGCGHSPRARRGAFGGRRRSLAQQPGPGQSRGHSWP